MSLFLVYFGVRGTYPDLAHHTILFGPRYRELLDDIFNRGVLADDFSLYLHSPSVTDPGLSPPGHSTHYVLAPVPHLGISDVDWETAGPELAERILSAVEARCMPGRLPHSKRRPVPPRHRDLLRILVVTHMIRLVRLENLVVHLRVRAERVVKPL